tara:strand:+ start:260 stop:1666 length:1407 start_codon:yes stop_codon:yes gene_type:complete
MSNNRDLLTEAIADAKAVKETAIANAKLALEEAFTPHLKSMLSAKLEEIDKDDDVKEGAHEEDEMKEGMHEKDKKVDEYGSMKKYEEDDVKKEGMHDSKKDKEVEEEINLDELLAELDEEVSDADKKAIDREVDAVRDDLDQISKLAKDAGEDAEDIKDKIDEAKHEDDKMEEAAHADDKDDVKEDARTDAEEEGYLDGMKDEKEDMEDDEIDLDDLSEDDLKDYIEAVIKDMVSAGELEPGDEFVEDEVEVEDVEDVDVEDDVDVDIEVSEGKHKDDEKKVEEKMSNPVMRKGDDEKKGGKFKKESKPEIETEKDREINEMDEVSWNEKNNPTRSAAVGERDPKKVGQSTSAYAINVREALEEVDKLKSELKEVNLLNAKLLYSNKIFKAKNLTENKKVKVLKAFDKAKDVKEAKVIYDTLNEGLTNNSVNNIRSSASSITGKAPERKPIVESDAMVARFKKLAGII